jgi:ComF family protein
MNLPLRQHLKNSVKSVAAGIRYFFFAPECHECHSLLKIDEKEFCNSCLTLFEMLVPSERCERCFLEMGNTSATICSECLKEDVYLERAASACDYQGPAATMVRLMKYGNLPHLAKTAAAYMALQWVELEWPKADYIVPVPSTWLRRFDRGYNQSELIAKELGTILGIPVAKNLKRRLGDHSQAGLPRGMRFAQPLESFFLRRSPHFADKIVLIVDDVMTTGKTLNACAKVLQGHCPKEIQAMTFCRTHEDRKK